MDRPEWKNFDKSPSPMIDYSAIQDQYIDLLEQEIKDLSIRLERYQITLESKI